MNYTKLTVSSGTTAYLSAGETQILPAQGKHRNNSKLLRRQPYNYCRQDRIYRTCWWINFWGFYLLSSRSIHTQSLYNLRSISSVSHKKKKKLINSALQYEVLTNIYHIWFQFHKTKYEVTHRWEYKVIPFILTLCDARSLLGKPSDIFFFFVLYKILFSLSLLSEGNFLKDS